MIDKRISKTELTRIAGISTNAMAKLGRDEDVRMAVLEKICSALIVKSKTSSKFKTMTRLLQQGGYSNG